MGCGEARLPFREDEQLWMLQVSPSSMKKVPANGADPLGLIYQQLWLCAMREFSEMPAREEEAAVPEAVRSLAPERTGSGCRSRREESRARKPVGQFAVQRSTALIVTVSTCEEAYLADDSHGLTEGRPCRPLQTLTLGASCHDAVWTVP